jgi:hypothetical protein
MARQQSTDVTNNGDLKFIMAPCLVYLKTMSAYRASGNITEYASVILMI